MFVSLAAPYQGLSSPRQADHLPDGRLEDAAGMAIDSARDRAMICGSMAMLKDMYDLLVGRGFVEGSNARPAGLVIEKAFVG